MTRQAPVTRVPATAQRSEKTKPPRSYFKNYVRPAKAPAQTIGDAQVEESLARYGLGLSGDRIATY